MRPDTASRTALGRTWPPVGPGTTKSSRLPNRSRASSARRTGGAAAVLALVETMAPPNPRHSAAATGWAEMRTATFASLGMRRPVKPAGTCARAGTSQVTGGSASRGSRPNRRSNPFNPVRAHERFEMSALRSDQDETLREPPPLDRRDPVEGRHAPGVAANPVHRFRRVGDDPAAAQDFDRPGQPEKTTDFRREGAKMPRWWVARTERR